MTSSVARLSFLDVRKSFSATCALNGVSFDVAPGEVHALLGANGAGKSTLIKILAGVYNADEGRVLVDGKAPNGQISFIHQDLGLVDTMTIAEAIAMTTGFPKRAGLINWTEVKSAARTALSQIGTQLNVDALISDLSRADRSIVAIARAIVNDCKVLVLDEPTASLPDRDVNKLFEIIASLKSRGVSILYVTHRLDEVYQIADVVTVLRDGNLVKTAPIGEVSRGEMVNMIVGSDLPDYSKTSNIADQGSALIIKGVTLSDERPQIEEIRIKKGEIVGFAGLRGSGQEFLGRGLAGVAPLIFQELNAGDGTFIAISNARKWLNQHVGFGTSRREVEGLALTLTVRENLYLNPRAIGNQFFSWVSPKNEARRAKDILKDLQIRPSQTELASGTLSGGNQQKVILGRLLEGHAQVLVLEEPTMGIDVGARLEIYRVMQEAASTGRSIIVVSSDFEEIPLICHRVLIFDRGVVVKELIGSEITTDLITSYCTGVTPEAVVA